MNQERLCYENTLGVYCIEGFAFKLRLRHGEVVIEPAGLRGPPEPNFADNYVGGHVSIHANGHQIDQFSSKSTFLHSSALIFSKIATDIDDLILNNIDSIVFPSSDIGQLGEWFHRLCIHRNRSSPLEWTVFYRYTTHKHWNDHSIHDIDLDKYEHFAGAMSILSEVDTESLLMFKSSITEFVSWFNLSLPK